MTTSTTRPLPTRDEVLADLAELSDGANDYVGCSLLMTVRGDSMAPAYPDGLMVLLRMIDSSSTLEAGDYAIERVDGSRRFGALAGATEETITLRPRNSQAEPQRVTVRRDQVHRLYRVIGTIATAD